MIIKTLAFIAYILFAAYILYGEIGLNRYGAKQGALNRIDIAEAVEIKATMEFEAVASNVKTYMARMGTIDDNSGTMNEKNKVAIAERGTSVKPYNEKVIGNDNHIGSIQSEYQQYVEGIVAPIKKKYDAQRDEAKKESNLVSLGFAMPCAALFLCLFSAWVYPPGTPLSKNRGLQGSYVAQFMSCVITYDAVLIQQGVWLKAWALSVGAFIAIPTGHYFAGLLWLQIQSEYAAWKANRMEAKIAKRQVAQDAALQAKQMEQREARSATLTHATTTTQEHKITIEMIPGDFSKAIELVAQERKLGNGDGLGAMVAKKFGKSEAWVSKSVKKLIESGETH